MDIIERVGDFLAGDENVIIHGCNAQGEMGAGAAWAVRKRLPFAYNAYRAVYFRRQSEGSELRLGEVIWAINVIPHRKPIIVGNAITQKYYGSGSVFVDYEAVRMAIRAVNAFAQRLQNDVQIASLPPITTIAMPMIGAGHGGGSWEKIAPIIEAESLHFTPVVYRLPESPASTGG